MIGLSKGDTRSLDIAHLSHAVRSKQVLLINAMAKRRR